MTESTPNIRLLNAGLGTFVVAFPAMVLLYTMLF